MRVRKVQSRWALRVCCVRSAWKEGREHAGSGSWLAARKVHCHSMRKLFSPRTGCDRKERSVVRQCWRQAEVAKEGSEESELVRLALILSEQFVFLNYLCLPRNEVGPNFRT